MPHKTYKGLFNPTHPEKYAGNLRNITYRSGWELKVMKWLDKNDAVVKWVSESFAVPYFSTVDKRMHSYFPDFFVTIKDKNGDIKNHVIEVKPHYQTQPPTAKTKNLIEEAVVYTVNCCKWKAARAICDKYNWQFSIWTEKNISFLK